MADNIETTEAAEVEIKECEYCDKPSTVEHDGELFCKDCFDERYFTCSDCGDIESRDDAYNTNNGIVCEECLNENYFMCEDCEEAFPNNDAISVSGRRGAEKYICQDCFDNSYFRCDSCRDNFHMDSGTSCGSDRICDGCYSDYYFTCDDCGEVYHNDNYAQDGLCASCYHESNGSIHDSGFNPGWSTLFATDEKIDKSKYACGFELEMEGDSETAETIVDKYSEDVFVCKEDGSLQSGFEVVSHPFTWEWYKENKKDVLATLLNIARTKKMTSHDNGRCGLHIHINKRAFVGSWHIYKFTKFIFDDANSDFIRTISRRKCFSYCRLSNQDGIYSDNIPGKIKKPYEFAHHYDGVSLSPSKTIELRIFRGSLKDLSFFSSLEFAKALFEYTKDSSGKQLTVDEFLKWLKNEKDYAILKKYLVSKNYGKNLFNDKEVK